MQDSKLEENKIGYVYFSEVGNAFSRCKTSHKEDWEI